MIHTQGGVSRRGPFFALLFFVSGLFLMGISQCQMEDDFDGDEWTEDDGDCNDEDSSIHPGASEVCDGIDQDCDGLIDEDLPIQDYYQDLDRDGVGTDVEVVSGCTAPDGFAEIEGDCDDSNPIVYLDAPEQCDGLDNNCDGGVDEGVTSTWYLDADFDGYGISSSPMQSCSQPAGYAPQPGDCNDGNANIHPGMDEMLNGIDDNCSGSADEGLVTPDVSAGFYHGVALRSDGTVYTWGDNAYGQLGDGSVTDRNKAVKVNINTVVAIATGSYHTLALKYDGTVWCWGYTYTGECGTGSGSPISSPKQITGLSGITAIAAGANHSIAVAPDGSLRAWGLNSSGQLGDGSTITRTTPVTILTLANVTHISAGGVHSLARRSDGTAWSWGDNSAGQLGDGTTTRRTSPIQITSLSNYTTSIKGGGLHSIALVSYGPVLAWGSNTDGQLGDGTTTGRATPTQVPSLSNVTYIAAGAYHSLSTTLEELGFTWGKNGTGQLGNASMTSSSTPVQVKSLTALERVAGGWGFSVGLRSDETVYAWGENNQGQLGNGTLTNASTAVQVQNIP